MTYRLIVSRFLSHSAGLLWCLVNCWYSRPLKTFGFNLAVHLKWSRDYVLLNCADWLEITVSCGLFLMITKRLKGNTFHSKDCVYLNESVWIVNSLSSKLCLAWPHLVAYNDIERPRHNWSARITAEITQIADYFCNTIFHFNCIFSHFFICG